MLRQSVPAQRPADAVLTKATLRAADALGLSGSALAQILGLSEASVSRLHGERVLDHQSKQGELALLLLRVFRSLDTLVGGQQDKARAWFGAYNTHLSGVPSELVRKAEGLVRVAEYLDAMRGKL